MKITLINSILRLGVFTFFFLISCGGVEVSTPDDNDPQTPNPDIAEVPIPGEEVSDDIISDIVISPSVTPPENPISDSLSESDSIPAPLNTSDQPLVDNIQGLGTLNSIENYVVNSDELFIFQFMDYDHIDLLSFTMDNPISQWENISSPLPYYGYVNASENHTTLLLQNSNLTYPIIDLPNSTDISGDIDTYKEFIAVNNTGVLWTDFGPVSELVNTSISSGSGTGGGGGGGGGGIYTPTSSSSTIYNRILFKTFNGSVTELSGSTSYKARPQLSSTHATWNEYFPGSNIAHIVLFDLNSHTESIISSSINHADRPRIESDYVVWEEYEGSNVKIMAYRISTQQTLTICSQNGFRTNPDILGNIIVWEDQRDGNGDIYGYDLITGTEFSIITGLGHSGLPRLTADRIIWIESNAEQSSLISAHRYF
jgi:beta propeller repeat protein